MGRPGGIAVHEVDVKYAIFALAVVIAVPLMTAVALSSEKARGWLLSAALFSICLGELGLAALDARLDFTIINGDQELIRTHTIASLDVECCNAPGNLRRDDALLDGFDHTIEFEI